MAQSGRQLDRSHGFLKQIIQNQIDRDEYDRQLKEREQCKSSTRGSGRRDKARPSNAPVYVPPHRRSTGGTTTTDSPACDTSSSSSSAGGRRRLVVDSRSDASLLETYRHKARERIARQLKHENGQGNASPTGSVPKSGRKVVESNDPLFTLQILDQNGQTHTCVIRKNDSAARVAKKYCVSLGLNDAFAGRLRRQIEARMAANCGQPPVNDNDVVLSDSDDDNQEPS